MHPGERHSCESASAADRFPHCDRNNDDTTTVRHRRLTARAKGDAVAVDLHIDDETAHISGHSEAVNIGDAETSRRVDVNLLKLLGTLRTKQSNFSVER